MSYNVHLNNSVIITNREFNVTLTYVDIVSFVT